MEPTLIWLKDGREVTVTSEAEIQGYIDLGLYAALKDPITPDDAQDEPTFGPPGDQSHAKRGSKKK